MMLWNALNFEERPGGNRIIMWGRQVGYKKEKAEWDAG